MFLGNRGFTLIEIMTALAILSVIVMSSLSLFTHSTLGIFSSGEKSRSLYDAAGDMEGLIAVYSGPYDGTALVIVFPGDNPVEIEGKSIRVDYEYNGHSGDITYFAPK